MAILPVWKAWSRVHNEIRWSLKHRKDIQDPAKALKTNTTISSIRNYICKLLSFGKVKKQEKTKSKIPNITSARSKIQGDEKFVLTTNECALIANHCTANLQRPSQLLPLQSNLQNLISREKQTNVENKFEESPNKNKAKLNRKKLYNLSESRTSLRKRRSRSRREEKKNALQKRNHNIVGDANNFLRKRKDSSIRSSVRNKLAQKNAEINGLFEREYALTKELNNKFKIYKLRNELYTKSDKNLELSVGQIQQNIEACAKDIIQTEHELLEIKNEIKHDISIINNLKRLTLESDVNQCGVPTDHEARYLNLQQPKASTVQSFNIITNLQCKEMEFVDNIYEFCDNNASMLV
ncbi:hypothetical protein DOY81_007507 [Sarcophaga bullata]|nr:hypothetical protein DOY81_007507 [Sarcophaga bullata]